MTEPSPATDGKPARARRPRTLTETLGSIVLACELLVVFLASLVAFGLNAVEPLPPFAALIAGGVLCVALIVGVGVLRRPWGVAYGWATQVVLVATGIFVPVMFFVGALFAAMWAYAVIQGTKIDQRNRANSAHQ